MKSSAALSTVPSAPTARAATTIDWPRIIGANRPHCRVKHQSIVAETLIGHSRRSKMLANLDHVILCVGVCWY